MTREIRRLGLSRETVRELTAREAREVEGGQTPTSISVIHTLCLNQCPGFSTFGCGSC